VASEDMDDELERVVRQGRREWKSEVEIATDLVDAVQTLAQLQRAGKSADMLLRSWRLEHSPFADDWHAAVLDAKSFLGRIE
jgi:hypothetical protein